MIVVAPNAMAVEGPPKEDEPAAEKQLSVTDLVEEPAKVMRIATMIRQLLEEVRSAPLDDASRIRLRDLQSAAVSELGEGLAPELAEELNRLVQPFAANTTPSDAELRISQAQLVGWLEGLFSGLQTALVAQQMAARSQLEQMRRQLPGPMQTQANPAGEGRRPDGMYL